MIYEYDDVVTAKDVLTGRVKKEDIIGKRGWLLDFIPIDMNMDEIEQEGLHSRLGEIDLDSASPFGDGDGCVPFTYFLPEKEESAAEPAISGTAIKETEEKPCGEKSYVERQAEWVKANNLKPGDKVRILRGFEPLEDGFCTSMNPLMKDLVGEVLTVIEATHSAIKIWNKDLSDFWVWPYFVLEKVKDKTEKSAPEKRTWLEDIAYRLYECMHSRYVAFCKQDDYLTVSGFTYKPCFSEENGIWYPGKSEKWSMYDLSIPDAAYSDCPEEWKVDGKVDFSKAIIDMEAGEGPSSIKRDEDAPEYVPFDLSDPKDRGFLRGKWIKRKENGHETLISFFAQGFIAHEGSSADAWSANNCSSEYLFDEYTFLDGSPVGRRKDN